jgi:hypothetical protein
MGRSSSPPTEKAPVVLVASLALVAACSGIPRSGSVAHATVRAAPRCEATLVHYRPYKGVEPGLASLPWIAASPVPSGLVGHLFYYDRLNVWRRKRLPRLRIYSGGQSPDGRISMKIFWELRRGSASAMNVYGKKLDSSRSFSQQLSPAAGSSTQFPSIIDVPTPGCWRLTVRAGKTTGRVVFLVLPGKIG